MPQTMPVTNRCVRTISDKRPRRLRVDRGGLRVRQFQECQNGNRDDAERHQRDESTGEGDRCEDILAENGKLRPDDRRDDATRQYPGNGFRLVERGGCVGSSKADFLREAAGNADQQQADRKQPEVGAEECYGSNAAADGAHQRADHEARLAAKKTRCCGNADGAQRHADVETGKRRRCQRLVSPEQLVTGKRADREAHRCCRAHDRLCGGQEEDVALRLVQLNFKSGDGNGAHIFLT